MTNNQLLHRIPYDQGPDFTRASLQIPRDTHQQLLSRLSALYGTQAAECWIAELERILKVHWAHKPPALIEAERDYQPEERFTEKDVVLITYGDSIQGDHGAALLALHKFIQTYNRGAINTIHLLPFFPYSSDRGFAVVDFSEVDPSMGTWECIQKMGADYDLMFDGVVNHCSSRSEMFKQFLCGNPQYRNFFIAYDSPGELTPDQRSKIFRPRTSDILTRFDTIDGPKYVWTTFSEDQIDFNFRNPQVLLAVVEALLFYIRQGADIIRLDAVTYLWSEPGTECIHLPQTHTVIKLLRDIVDCVAPGVALITETNVPHRENISYFGNGHDEAHMVYNFALPPLVLHTFYTRDATALSQWAEGLTTDSNTATFFNILDTHDGIGVMGVKGILEPAEIEALIQTASEHGALISYKSTEYGEEPYEINATWWSAINRDDIGEDLELRVRRHVASRTVALVLKGVPGAYTHGVLGLANSLQLVEQTGVKRDINRGVIDPKLYATQLEDPRSKRSLLRSAYGKIAQTRTQHRAFHPQGRQHILHFTPTVFAVLRSSPEGDEHILCLISVTDQTIQLEVPLSQLNVSAERWENILGNQVFVGVGDKLEIDLEPYEVVWLTPTA